MKGRIGEAEAFLWARRGPSPFSSSCSSGNILPWQRWLLLFPHRTTHVAEQNEVSLVNVLFQYLYWRQGISEETQGIWELAKISSSSLLHPRQTGKLLLVCYGMEILRPRPEHERPAKARAEAVLWTPSVTQGMQLVLTLHLIPLLVPPHYPQAAWKAATVPHCEPSGRLKSLPRSSTECITGSDKGLCCSVQLRCCTGDHHADHNLVRHGHSWFSLLPCLHAPVATSLWDGEGFCHVPPASIWTSFLPAAASSTSLFHHQIQSYFCCNSHKSSR